LNNFILLVADIASQALTEVAMKSYFFWNITPYCPLEVSRHFGGTDRLYLQGRKANQADQARSKQKAEPVLLAACFSLVSWMAYSSTLKIGAICSSEMLVDLNRTTQFYIPEDGTLHPLADFRRMRLEFRLFVRYYQQ
jgi:hypothetical protein